MLGFTSIRRNRRRPSFAAEAAARTAPAGPEILYPVRPGDTLHTEVDVLEVRPSSTRPDRGIARFRYAAVNQRGETVLTFIVAHLLRRRPAG